MKSKNAKLIETYDSHHEGLETAGDRRILVQTFSYEMNKFWGSHVQFWGANAYSQCYTEYLKAAVRLEL